MKSHPHKGKAITVFSQKLLFFSPGFSCFCGNAWVFVRGSFPVDMLLPACSATQSCLHLRRAEIQGFCLLDPLPGCCWWPSCLAFSRSCQAEVWSA